MDDMNIKIYRKIVFFLCLLFTLAAESFASTLILSIIEKETGENIPARVLIKAGDGSCYYPPNSVLLNIGSETWFMSSGNSSIDLPGDSVMLRIERGKEYIRIKERILVPEDEILQKRVIMERWIDLKKLGYISAENHLHRSAEDVAALCAAEDLDFGTSLQWWNRPRFGVKDGNSNVAAIRFDGEIKKPLKIKGKRQERKYHVD